MRISDVSVPSLPLRSRIPSHNLFDPIFWYQMSIFGRWKQRLRLLDGQKRIDRFHGAGDRPGRAGENAARCRPGPIRVDCEHALRRRAAQLLARRIRRDAARTRRGARQARPAGQPKALPGISERRAMSGYAARIRPAEAGASLLGVFASVPAALTRREHRGAEVRVRSVRRSLDQRPPCPRNASE